MWQYIQDIDPELKEREIQNTFRSISKKCGAVREKFVIAAKRDVFATYLVRLLPVFCHECLALII